MVITGVRNTYPAMAQQLKSDFTGTGNFTYWIASLGAIGAIGYVDKLRPFANMFMVLVIIAIVLKNGGVFSQFKAAIDSGPQAPTTQGSNVQPSIGTALNVAAVLGA